MDKSRFVETSRRLLLILFGRFFPLSRLPASIGPDEIFARFLVHRNHFAPTTGRVKPAALEPQYNQHKLRWETSTYRTDGLSSARIWALGYRYVEDRSQGRTIRARATGKTALVAAAHLQWDVNSRPYPRHADIVGWSNTDKNLRMMAAVEIANEMQLQIDPGH